jgi:hypothetical protein
MPSFKITVIAATAAIGLTATAIALHDHSGERLASVRAALGEKALPSAQAGDNGRMIVADNTKKYEG